MEEYNVKYRSVFFFSLKMPLRRFTKLVVSNCISSDIVWLIEAKVQLAGKFSNPFVSYMSGFGKSTFIKRRRAN